MSRALVIKGVNFAENKLDTVHLSEIIPCTSITLSDDSVSFDLYGDTKTLLATVAPLDTTDRVVWSTSDESVVTVNNGVVTCVGIGSAIVTASCGSQVAQCTVSCTAVRVSLSNYYKLTGYRANVPSSGSYAQLSAQSNSFVWCSENNILGGYKAFYVSASATPRYCLPLPNNAQTFTVTTKVSGATQNGLWIKFQAFDTNTQADDTHDSALRLRNVSKQSPVTQWEINAPNANGFVVGFDGDATSVSYEDVELEITFE